MNSQEKAEIDPRLAGYRKWEDFDPFEEQSGPFYFREEADGRFRGAFISAPNQMNSAGSIHGGALMTFADYSLFVFARPSILNIPVVTVSLNTEFTSSLGPGEFVESTGEVVHETRSLIFVRGQIFTGSRMLANISGVLKKVRPRGKNTG